MSQSEDDIWGYKSIRKKKARERNVGKAASNEEPQTTAVKVKGKAAKKTGPAKNTTKVKKNKSPSKNSVIISPTKEQNKSPSGPGGEDMSTPKRPLKTASKNVSPSTPKAQHSGYCPSCQMPFAILLVQTPRWHVSECLDAPSQAQTECPNGLTCSSTIASHYKRYSHFLLAQSRADELSPFSSICTPDLPSPDTAKLWPSNGWNDINHSHSQVVGSSPSYTNKPEKLNSSQSRSPASSQGSVKQTSLDAWLSSPTKLSQNSVDFSQEIPSHKSASPVNAATFLGLSQQDEDIIDCAISYSPLVSDQELFSDDEDLQTDLVKNLLSDNLSTDTLENIVEQFAANKHFTTENRIQSPTQCNRSNEREFVQRNGDTHVADCSIEGDNWSECSTPVSVINE